MFSSIRLVLFVAVFGYTVMAPISGQLVTEAEKPKLKNVFQAIRESEYEIHWQDSVETYQAANRANNLRFTFFTDGFSAQRLAPVDENDEWSINFTLKGIGADKRFSASDATSTTVDKRKARVHSPAVLVDYENTEKGMRQDFVVKEKPQGGIKIDLQLALRDVGAHLDMEGGSIVYLFQPSTRGGSVHDALNEAIFSCWGTQDNEHKGWSVTFMDDCLYDNPRYRGFAYSSPDEDVGGNADRGVVGIYIWRDE